MSFKTRHLDFQFEQLLKRRSTFIANIAESNRDFLKSTSVRRDGNSGFEYSAKDIVDSQQWVLDSIHQEAMVFAESLDKLVRELPLGRNYFIDNTDIVLLDSLYETIRIIDDNQDLNSYTGGNVEYHYMSNGFDSRSLFSSKSNISTISSLRTYFEEGGGDQDKVNHFYDRFYIYQQFENSIDLQSYFDVCSYKRLKELGSALCEIRRREWEPDEALSFNDHMMFDYTNRRALMNLMGKEGLSGSLDYEGNRDRIYELNDSQHYVENSFMNKNFLAGKVDTILSHIHLSYNNIDPVSQILIYMRLSDRSLVFNSSDNQGTRFYRKAANIMHDIATGKVALSDDNYARFKDNLASISRANDLINILNQIHKGDIHHFLSGFFSNIHNLIMDQSDKDEIVDKVADSILGFIYNSKEDKKDMVNIVFEVSKRFFEDNITHEHVFSLLSKYSQHYVKHRQMEVLVEILNYAYPHINKSDSSYVFYRDQFAKDFVKKCVIGNVLKSMESEEFQSFNELFEDLCVRDDIIEYMAANIDGKDFNSGVDVNFFPALESAEKIYQSYSSEAYRPHLDTDLMRAQWMVLGKSISTIEVKSGKLTLSAFEKNMKGFIKTLVEDGSPAARPVIESMLLNQNYFPKCYRLLVKQLRELGADLNAPSVLMPTYTVADLLLSATRDHEDDKVKDWVLQQYESSIADKGNKSFSRGSGPSLDIDVL